MAIQDAGLTYHWGFPFSLQVLKDGRQVTLRSKDDLPYFLSALKKETFRTGGETRIYLLSPSPCHGKPQEAKVALEATDYQCLSRPIYHQRLMELSLMAQDDSSALSLSGPNHS